MKTRSTSSKPLSKILAICLLCMAAAATAADVSKSEATFTEAMAQYKQGNWSSAYGRFSALADQGHAEAARIALVMLRHGTAMYGSSWGASRPQIDQWMKLALQRMDPLKSESGD